MPFTFSGEWIPEKKAPEKPKQAIKIIRERRGNSLITVILNLPLNEEAMKELCSKIKQRLGCGGSVKNERVEIQGEKINEIKTFLIERGFKVSGK
jgi:translation initiation factor 1